MNKTIFFRSLMMAPCVVAGSISAAHAEITLLQQDKQPDTILSRLNLTVGGSLRPQFNNQPGHKDQGDFKRNGFDNTSRVRFSGNYSINDDISWIAYYELGLNIPAIFHWKNHYADGAQNTVRRDLYTGFDSKTLGRLTFGQQNSIYYDVVGAKTDIWDDDMLAQASSHGVNGDYDGSYRTRKLLKYRYTTGPVDLYAGVLFPDHTISTNTPLYYKRRGGGSLGVNYHITPDLSWGSAWNMTRAQIREQRGGSAGGNRNVNQHILGSAISWQPGQWTLSAGGGWYHHFVPTQLPNVRQYLDSNAWGIEYFSGYTVPVSNVLIQSVKPYFMGDRLEYVKGRHYQRIDNGLGISFQLHYGLRIDYEHVLTSATDHPGDMNLVRIWYDF